MNKKSSFNFDSFIAFSKSNCLYILSFCILIILIILLFHSKKNKNDVLYDNLNYSIENFIDSSDQNFGINFQTGLSSISPTGTIIFKTPFSKIPMIFTQMVNNTNGTSNIYSVQVFNITLNSFDYAKNMVSNFTSENISMPKLDKSTIEPFNWIAIG